MDEDVIILSDCDDQEISINDSVYIVENVKETAVCEQLNHCRPGDDEDFIITFSKRGEVLPHARYDCSTHTFTPSDCCVAAPLESNQLFCSQCFCYICDKVASECSVWSKPGLCHCNAHKKSVFWTSKRDKVVVGYLQIFNFNLLEIDSDLRLAESRLIQLEEELSSEYAFYLMGFDFSLLASQCSCLCHTANCVQCQACLAYHPQLKIYDYTRVFECVNRFLDRAEAERPRAAAVMRLGAAKLFITHQQPPGRVFSPNPVARVSEAVWLLLSRVTEAVRRQMLECDFSLEFQQKLLTFYRTFPLPHNCHDLKNRLCVLPWTDILLVSVLKGQNVTGVRPGKGKKTTLTECSSVVLLRAEILQRQNRYRELARYLKLVQTYKSSDTVKAVVDMIPLFLMKAGDFSSALSSFFTPPPGVCCPACRLTPHLFIVYLRILTTATAPRTSTDLSLDKSWHKVEGAVVPKLVDVVKFGLRIMKSCKAVYMDAQSWAFFIQILQSPTGPPDTTFLEKARDETRKILLDQGSVGQNIQIPRTFLEVYPEHSLMLLVTQAMVLRIIQQPFSTTQPIIPAYKENVWALQWLVEELNKTGQMTLHHQVPEFIRMLNEVLASRASPPSAPTSAGDVTSQPDDIAPPGSRIHQNAK
ncbi:hypothetical protein UPYG_G00056780 [Umbra pygmaea]|uniref:Uncharacterized protein n=1 Tax=Umbra pygmaea TaxID=75934 RepID=A0ABD0XNI0_UMBPY